MTIVNNAFSRNVLLADGLMGILAGIAVAAGSTLLAPLLNLPAALLFWAGAMLLPLGSFITWMARRDTFPRWMLTEIVFINVAWTIASFAVMVLGWVQPNLLGVAFISGQALAVGLLAALQMGILHEQSATA